eukprot:397389-Hanusia_phi.AAC.1
MSWQQGAVSWKISAEAQDPGSRGVLVLTSQIRARVTVRRAVVKGHADRILRDHSVTTGSEFFMR